MFDESFSTGNVLYAHYTFLEGRHEWVKVDLNASKIWQKKYGVKMMDTGERPEMFLN